MTPDPNCTVSPLNSASYVDSSVNKIRKVNAAILVKLAAVTTGLLNSRSSSTSAIGRPGLNRSAL
jgi:hypothetical protein